MVGEWADLLVYQIYDSSATIILVFGIILAFRSKHTIQANSKKFVAKLICKQLVHYLLFNFVCDSSNV